MKVKGVLFTFIGSFCVISLNAEDAQELKATVYTPLEDLLVRTRYVSSRPVYKDRVEHLRKIFVVYPKDAIRDKFKKMYGRYKESGVVAFNHDIMREDLTDLTKPRGSDSYLLWEKVTPTSSGLKSQLKNYIKKLLGQPGDDVGVVFDCLLGGLYGAYNAVPMNPCTERIWDTFVTKTMNTYVTNLSKTRTEVTFDVFFMYENNTSGRPNGLGVVIKGIDLNSPEWDFGEERYIVKGYIPNPISKDVSGYLDNYIYKSSLKKLYKVEHNYAKYELTKIGTVRPEWRVERITRLFKHPYHVRYSDRDFEDEFQHDQPLWLERNDVPGRIFSKELTNERVTSRWNVVPMLLRTSMLFKTYIDDPITLFFQYWHDHWGSYGKVCEVDVFVTYEDDESFRPTGFIIHLTVDAYSALPNRRYLFIPNPRYLE